MGVAYTTRVRRLKPPPELDLWDKFRLVVLLICRKVLSTRIKGSVNDLSIAKMLYKRQFVVVISKYANYQEQPLKCCLGMRVTYCSLVFPKSCTYAGTICQNVVMTL